MLHRLTVQPFSFAPAKDAKKEKSGVSSQDSEVSDNSPILAGLVEYWAFTTISSAARNLVFPLIPTNDTSFRSEQ